MCGDNAERERFQSCWQARHRRAFLCIVHTTLHPFKFSCFPPHFDLTMAAGQNAWKPAINLGTVSVFTSPSYAPRAHASTRAHRARARPHHGLPLRDGRRLRKGADRCARAHRVTSAENGEQERYRARSLLLGRQPARAARRLSAGLASDRSRGAKGGLAPRPRDRFVIISRPATLPIEPPSCSADPPSCSAEPSVHRLPARPPLRRPPELP